MGSILRPLSGVYSILAAMERAFFRQFPFLVHRPAARVISIGNLTMGGTGKTPILLELLSGHSSTDRVMVLTRGYRSLWERSSYLVFGPGPHPPALTDETLLVNRRFPGVPILLGKNRAHNARLGERWFSPDVIYLDDGFQYRRLKKNLELLLWDATLDPDRAALLPEGTLREPIERLNDASALLLTRCESVSPEILRTRTESLKRIAPGVPIVELKTFPKGWLGPDGRDIGLHNTWKRIFPFAAIGNPSSFATQLELCGLEVAGYEWFRDHHCFTLPELDALAEKARREKAILVCTEKDRVKIPAAWAERVGLYSLMISMAPVRGGTLSQALAALSLPPG